MTYNTQYNTTYSQLVGPTQSSYKDMGEGTRLHEVPPRALVYICVQIDTFLKFYSKFESFRVGKVDLLFIGLVFHHAGYRQNRS